MRLLMMLILALMVTSVIGILGVQMFDGGSSKTPPAVIQQSEPK
jgi:hypothetical protein